MSSENELLDASSTDYDDQIADLDNDIDTGTDNDAEPATLAPQAAIPESFDLVLDDDEPASQSEKVVPLDTHWHKLSAQKRKVKERDNEIESLKQELAAIRGQVSPPSMPTEPQFPTMEQFDYDENRYNQALAAYFQQQQQASVKEIFAQQQQQQQMQQQQMQMAAQVEKHVERAKQFVTENAQAGLNVDMYVQAEETVRHTIDPNQTGIMDQIVSKLGEGSPKVMYYLGRPQNQGELARIQSMLATDPSGIEALIYLGKLTGRLERAKSKPISKAPEPDAVLSSDQHATSMPNSEKQLRKAMEKAEKAEDPNAIAQLLKQARDLGVKLD